MNEQCSCNNHNEIYKIIENYRSILNRKQQFISSWKIFHNNKKIHFIHGSKFRKHTDALVICSNYIYLINPWYKYIDIKKNFLSILKQNQYYQIFEIILLECNCLINLNKYELAIIQCPCFEQLKTYCKYCRLILIMTKEEHSNILLSNCLFKNVSQQTNISFSLDFFHNDINIYDNFSSQLGPYQYQRTVQIQIESEQVLRVIMEYELNVLTMKKSINVLQPSFVSKTFDEDTDNSLVETKSIVLLHNDNIKQNSLQSNIENRSSISSISLPFLSQQNFSKIISRKFHSKNSLSSQDTIELNENLLFKKNRSQGTQTKLFAILLPKSPLSIMKQAKIEDRTLINITRTCQVNTLSYLIKTNENQTKIQYSLENISNIKQIVLDNKIRLNNELLSEEKISSTETNHQILIDHEQIIDVSTIEFDGSELLDDFQEEKINSTLINEKIHSNEEQSEEFILMSSPFKCINTCDMIDLDGSITPVVSLVNDDMNLLSISSDQQYCQPINISNLEHTDTQVKIYRKSFNNSNIHIIKCSTSNNNNEQLTFKQRNHSLASIDYLSSNTYQISKLFHLKLNSYRKRRQYRNKKRIFSFLQRQYHRQKSKISQLHLSEHLSSSYSSLIMPMDHYKQFDNYLLTTQTNTIKHNTSFNRSQQSIINLHLNNSDDICQYKAYDHIIVARASKTSTACKQLQTLLNNHDTFLEQFIDSQLLLTCNNDYRSICILIDDHKQSEQYRSSFLHYIYTTLSNTLKKIFENDSIQLTCMNLAFFNNSLCDIINMQRLRLIDTGRRILLQPSCEIALRTLDDINIAMNRLSTKMSFAHQIFIINFYSERSSLSGSFLFLQLAPICSIRSKGLLTNLNSTTYSVLNLIRQLSNGQLFNHNRAKRYLLNDYSLNRLLKNYLFSPQQTMTVITIKSKQQQQQQQQRNI
ncbi:unnamed protein product [Rotaria sordida]|uniref:Uncharacterized protein n=1 Tax=Rotaria sordida TaxID=392033 RepID=A0A814G1Q4_9BILA|nr:unnamed protein product [Rotaria sordida]